MKDLFGVEIALEPEKPVKAKETAKAGVLEAKGEVRWRPCHIIKDSPLTAWCINDD